MVRGGPEVRFYRVPQSSTRILQGFHKGSTTRVQQGSTRFHKGSTNVLLGSVSPELVFLCLFCLLGGRIRLGHNCEERLALGDLCYGGRGARIASERCRGCLWLGVALPGRRPSVAVPHVGRQAPGEPKTEGGGGGWGGRGIGGFSGLACLGVLLGEFG